MADSLPLALKWPNVTIRLRPVRTADARALQMGCFPDESMTQMQMLVDRAERLAQQGRGGGIVLLDETETRLLGYGQVTLWMRTAEISDLAVTESRRGQGYGTALLQTLVQIALAHHADRVEIGASVDNPRALALYRRLGFIDMHKIDFGTEHIQYLVLDLTRFR